MLPRAPRAIITQPSFLAGQRCTLVLFTLSLIISQISIYFDSLLALTGWQEPYPMVLTGQAKMNYIPFSSLILSRFAICCPSLEATKGCQKPLIPNTPSWLVGQRCNLCSAHISIDPYDQAFELRSSHFGVTVGVSKNSDRSLNIYNCCFSLPGCKCLVFIRSSVCTSDTPAMWSKVASAISRCPKSFLTGLSGHLASCPDMH